MMSNDEMLPKVKLVQIRGGGGGGEGGGGGRRGLSINQSINQLYLNTVNGSTSWFSDMPCDNYNFATIALATHRFVLPSARETGRESALGQRVKTHGNG